MSDQTRSLDRRRFLKVAGVTGAGAAVMSGCSTDRVEKLIPYLVQHQDQVPGIPTYYASTCTECPTGCGLHVKTREARAIKLEGNPNHPINAGTICARGQASLQGLYNPDRLRSPFRRGGRGAMEEITWHEAIEALADELQRAGTRVAVISGAGPGTFSDLLSKFVTTVGGKLVRYQAFDNEPLRLASQRVFGLNETPAHDFAAARYVLSFGADFLETWNSPIENQRGFAESHGFNNKSMAKFAYVGPRMSLTGINADQWLAPKPGTEVTLALGIAQLLASRPDASAETIHLQGLLGPYTVDRVAQETGLPAADIEKLAAEFAAAKPSLAVAGGIGSQHRASVELCAAVHLINVVAGNIGTTVKFGTGVPAGDGYAALAELQKSMAAGEIDLLIVHEANPVHTVPRAAGFKEALAKVRYKVSTSMYLDDTAAASDLLIPTLHSLERWDDVVARNGVRGLMQPVMERVFKNVATGDVLIQVASKVGGSLAAAFPEPTFEEHLKTAWKAIGQASGASSFEEFWRASLAGGGRFEPAAAPAKVTLQSNIAISATAPTFEGSGTFVFAPYPSAMYYDGRGANRPWLLENPDPVTKITWQSWVEVHPTTAKELDVRNGEIIRLEASGAAIEAPVYIYPGIRPEVLAMPIGLGHVEYGRYAKGRGANPLDLLPGSAPDGFVPYLSTKVAVTKTGRYHKVATTEGNPRELGRGITEVMPLGAATKGLTVEEAYKLAGHEPHEINTEREVEAIKGFRESQVQKRYLGDNRPDNPQWSMVIDLSRCTGCSACVTACYAENNIPVVGEEDVLRGREMSWMRVERYFHGGDEHEPVTARVIPMLCQHCDNAPCEPVCPVYAAYHTADGLNGQVYNRCVGTRYCGNNCPYKVRYFNWYPYAKRAFVEPLNLQLNPDVTVRARGVMEKCTFCVQRIRGAQNTARLENRELRDGDVITACAQACPSKAITFGNIRDPDSRVARAADDHRRYHVLEDLNVRPNVTYLAKVTAGSEGSHS